MKHKISFGTSSQATAYALCLIGLCAAQRSEAQKYTVTHLHPDPTNVAASGAAMNNAGVVVGNVYNSDGNSSAAEWVNGVPRVIYFDDYYPDESNGAEAAAINNQGIVVGNAYDTESSVFEIEPNTVVGISYDHGIDVAAISDTNIIVGTLGGHPAIWDGVDLSQYPGYLSTTNNNYGVSSQPMGINAAGVIVGIEYDNLPGCCDTYAVAVKWLPDPVTHAPAATVKALGTLGGLSSGANAVNANGWVVGWAAIGNQLQHATLWEPTSGAFDLGTLGGKQSAANAVNLEGDIAGTAQTGAGAWHAVLWTHKHFVATDLNLEISSSLAKQFTLTSAVATNDRCMVLANGVDNKTGTQETFVLQLAVQSQCNEP